MPSNNSPSFRHGDVFAAEETRSVEFKEIKGGNPIGAITNAADEYAVAFLNSEGGRIYWGIEDPTRRVVGVKLSYEQRDELRRKVSGKLHTILPPIDPTRFKINFHAVEGNRDASDLYVVELVISEIATTTLFSTSSGDFFVRVDGVKRRLVGPQVTDWIQRRSAPSTSAAVTALEPKLLELVRRVRRVFEAHGLEFAHLARFFERLKAPFSIAFTDLQSDGAFLAWLNSARIEWIAQTFLIRREWIEGEDDQIHETQSFDKQPRRFFETVSRHTDPLIYQDLNASPDAYFIQWGLGADWERKGESRIFVVIAVPLACMSHERTIYKYICELSPSPWTYGRTNIELRAWARLLFVNKRIPCFGRAVSYKLGGSLWSNSIFIPELINDYRLCPRVDWNPEDHALYAEESLIAKDVETLPQVIDFLRSHQLPWERTNLGPPSQLRKDAVIAKYEGLRVKIRDYREKDQYFVHRGEAHYLEVSAALICDEKNIPFAEIESEEMAILMSLRGSDLNGARIRAIL